MLSTWDITFLSVIFRQSRVDIYPDETRKPDVGSGLNKNAEITLYRVQPKNCLSNTQKCLKVNKYTLLCRTILIHYEVERSWLSMSTVCACRR